jgi:hypothetical protein
LKEWLNSVNDMHDNFKSRLPEFIAPEFSCVDDIEDENEEAIILHYYSLRGSLLAPVVVGMVTEVAKNSFNMNIRMERIATQDENGSRFTSWRITLISLFNPLLDSKASLLRQTSKKTQQFSDPIAKAAQIISKTRQVGPAPGSACPFTGMRPGKQLTDPHLIIKQPTDSHLLDSFSEEKSGCPFSVPNTARGAPPSSSRHSTAASNHYSSTVASHVGSYAAPANNAAFFSPQQLQDLFPFHIVVDQNFTVIQEGNKLASYLHGLSPMGTHIGNVFQLKFPKCEWDWQQIILNLDSSFELRLANTTFVTDMLNAQSKGRAMGGAAVSRGSSYMENPSNRNSAPSSAMPMSRPTTERGKSGDLRYSS